MTPTLSVVFGVIVNQYSERERYALVHALELYGSVSPICPQGVSAEIRGEWLSAWIEILGGEENCVFMDADMRMYDGSHSRDTFREAHNTTLNQCAITPPEARAALMTKRELRGRSHGGVTFKIKNKMGSGFSDTTLTGTKVNEMGTVSALEAPAGSTQPVEPKMLGREYAIAPNGDDIFGVLSRAWFESKFDCMGIAYDRAEAHYVEYWKSLGFEVVPHFRRHLWEVDFLSKLWYPCEGTYILGGKIGRVFSRVGWFLDCKDEMTIRGAAISAFQDNAHVPFLREYFEHVIKLTKGMKVSGRPAEHSVHTTRAHMYDEDTLAFVENRYGLTHKDLEDFVGLLQTVTRLPAVISWPHLERCVSIDA